jgi:pyruvate dehydrogenase E1 component beta subunit
MVTAINSALREEMSVDDRVVVYGQDVGVNGGVFRATVDLQKSFGKNRVFDTALAESGIVGTSFGMAVAGLRPVVEIQFSGFAWPAFNQIISHLARIRNRTRGKITAPIVVRMPYGGGIRAVEHHSESMEAIWGHVPGLKVVIPSTPHDAKGLLIASIRDPDPVIFMEPKRVYRSPKQEIPEGVYTLPIGKARVVIPGTDVTLVSYGAQMKEALAAAVRLRSKNISAELIATVNEEAFYSLEAPPVRLTGADTVVPLARSEKHYLITTDLIVKKVRNLVGE